MNKIYKPDAFYLVSKTDHSVAGPYSAVASAVAVQKADQHVFAGAELNAVSSIGLSEQPLHTAPAPGNPGQLVGVEPAAPTAEAEGGVVQVMGYRPEDDGAVMYRLSLDTDNSRKLVAAERMDPKTKQWEKVTNLADLEADMQAGNMRSVATAEEVLARRKGGGKNKSPRQQLLSELMSGFSGENGEKAANAFVKGDVDGFMAAFNAIGEQLKGTIAKKGDTGGAATPSDGDDRSDHEFR